MANTRQEQVLKEAIFKARLQASAIQGRDNRQESGQKGYRRSKSNKLIIMQIKFINIYQMDYKIGNIRIGIDEA
jgi:hypothetical protein